MTNDIEAIRRRHTACLMGGMGVRVAMVLEDVAPLCDEVELLREQLGDALETIRRLTPSVSAPKGLCIATISGGGGVGGPTGPDYTVWTPDGATLHGEEARRFLEAPHAPKGDADV